MSRLHFQLILPLVVLSFMGSALSAQLLSIRSFEENPLDLYLGLEYAELMQNPGTGIDTDNWSITAGTNNLLPARGLGFSYLGFSVELGDDHLQNSNQVAFLEGPRETITGDVSAHRLWVDWTPISIQVLPSFFVPDDPNLSILRVTPVLMTGPGWGSWVFEEKHGPESYRLRAVSWSLGLRLRSTIAGFLFIENPLFDAFLYVWKSRTAAGRVGQVEITRPEEYGLFSWATIGISISGLRRIIEGGRR